MKDAGVRYPIRDCAAANGRYRCLLSTILGYVYANDRAAVDQNARTVFVTALEPQNASKATTHQVLEYFRTWSLGPISWTERFGHVPLPCRYRSRRPASSTGFRCTEGNWQVSEPASSPNDSPAALLERHQSNRRRRLTRCQIWRPASASLAVLTSASELINTGSHRALEAAAPTMWTWLRLPVVGRVKFGALFDENVELRQMPKLRVEIAPAT